MVACYCSSRAAVGRHPHGEAPAEADIFPTARRCSARHSPRPKLTHQARARRTSTIRWQGTCGASAWRRKHCCGVCTGLPLRLDKRPPLNHPPTRTHTTTTTPTAPPPLVASRRRCASILPGTPSPPATPRRAPPPRPPIPRSPYNLPGLAGLPAGIGGDGAVGHGREQRGACVSLLLESICAGQRAGSSVWISWPTACAKRQHRAEALVRAPSCRHARACMLLPPGFGARTGGWAGVDWANRWAAGPHSAGQPDRASHSRRPSGHRPAQRQAAEAHSAGGSGGGRPPAGEPLRAPRSACPLWRPAHSARGGRRQTPAGLGCSGRGQSMRGGSALG